MDRKDVTIIGAGMGGLFSGALWAKHGHQVQIYESHYASGGCAGYFKRKEGYYDVGATTLSGLKKNRPLDILLRELKIKLDVEKLDNAIVILHPEFKFNFFADINKLANELDKNFKIHSLPFLKSLIKKEEMLWECLNIFNTFPKINPIQIFNFLFSKNCKLILTPKIFTKSFFEILPNDWKNNQSLIALIDQILLISTQQKSKECPAFIGILGFLYPRDTYHLKGGMRTLCLELENFIAKNNGVINFRHKVISTQQKKQGHRITTDKNDFETDILISATMPGLISKKLQKEQKWTALTSYLYFTQEKLTNSHYQIHLDQYQSSILETDSIFISASDVMDTKRSTKGHQLVTISTHAKKKLITIEMKENFKKVIIDIFKKYFNIEEDEIFFDSVASSKTFEHFTQRPQGEVGGIIIRNIFDVFSLPSNTLNKNTYLVGDYTFPGQGIVAIARGALNTLKL
ncbi:NAD(P)/FAD-dependent oxidoreductase [Bacteriovorax sp. Seq25_V]|uniref:phytoene desaturase family protein n=1 Tax=Bacteriovorax sp. Seq25_V TaxID=1201288 RepID=UPI00038A23FE|nr:NAD(P)-binding protein [Bacteriovorax sp. Seq25_V]EQC46132.1 NAD(P)-binding Rossmann-like domain protein [Bacteriovorax sp. Seq25_V]